VESNGFHSFDSHRRVRPARGYVRSRTRQASTRPTSRGLSSRTMDVVETREGVTQMNAESSFLGSRAATVVGLVVGAMGIAILWASGVEFPIYPPPGIVILVTGALFLTLARWWWAPAVGALLGLFVVVGFLLSPTGLSNLAGEAGASVAIGQAIQVVGALTALVAGVVATRANYRSRSRRLDRGDAEYR
jgi:hypothetical protein